MTKFERGDRSKVSFLREPYDDNSFVENKEENETSNYLAPKELPPWDSFKTFPTKTNSGSMQENKCLDVCTRISKVLVYGFLFCFVLFGGVIAKFVFLFAVSQLNEEKSVRYCDYYSEFSEEVNAKISKTGKLIWTWYIIFMFAMSECFSFIQAIWYLVLTKKQKMPSKESIAILFLIEALHPFGLSLLIFAGLSRLNSVDAAALSYCLCFIPALLNLLSKTQRPNTSPRMFILLLACDILALITQAFGISLSPFLGVNLHDPYTWILPVALVLSSCRWWNNFVSHHSRFGFIKFLAKANLDLAANRHVLQGCTAIWRCLIFFSTTIVITVLQGSGYREFYASLQQNRYDIELIRSSNSSLIKRFPEANTYFTDTIFQRGGSLILTTSTSAPLYAFLLQSFCAVIVYQAAKFAYRTHMHRFGFAFPINIVTFASVSLISICCFMRKQNPCVFHDFLPDFLFFTEPSENRLKDFYIGWHFWCWFPWWLSQMWITSHLWSNDRERLALVEKIFCASSYDCTAIDQFFALNIRKLESHKVVEEGDSDSVTEFASIEMGTRKTKNANESNDDFPRNSKNVKANNCVTQIYACATMWHEEKEEMDQLIGSILRLDRDQCAMRVTQKYYKVSIKDYYELESHIFFDDAFRCLHGCCGSCAHNENETQVNQYVIALINTVQDNVERLCMSSSPPIKYPTPYGGQLVWTLPGKTRLTVHLKDKNKIRHRKRWSQVMYMYYLLGYRLMGSQIDVDQKELIAENTYILTLDGDIDFRPTAVKILVDLMKKDRDLGAACGRIHPVGSGPMVWFQKFEYAIGHWLQKSTEHTIGSVLCSPGCFSLFRGKALIQDNVLAKYATESTEPRHYVQYDQGEDRWLCTLILQVGFRVEYSAASDAYTHAPETFRDLYIQRRRWIPSTVANICDLLSTSAETRKVNDDISWLYIVYHWALMGSTILGPGTIFLMLVGAFVTTFEIDNWTSLGYNMIPIFVFIGTCFFFKEHIQLMVAEVITALYGLVMIVVLVGITLQIVEDGWCAPSTLFFFIISSQLIITGILHPQELSCLLCGIMYYITVPSMYMLLIIFSIFNIHNVTWGTRETKSHVQTKQDIQNDLSEHPYEKPSRGHIEFSVAGLFKCICCTLRDSGREEKLLRSIHNSIKKINNRLERIELDAARNAAEQMEKTRKIKRPETCEKPSTSQYTESLYYKDISLQSETSTEKSEVTDERYFNYLISPRWLQDDRIRKGEVDFLSNSEEEFWKQLIEKYLHPIDNDEEKQRKIAEELISMRNAYILKFFMINAIFVLVVFLMQVNKEFLHVEWPFGARYNISYDTERDEVHVIKDYYLRLEPIGCVFIIAFVAILVIQFLAMLVHRFNTFSHILANVKLNFPCQAKKEYSSDGIDSKDAENIATGLQRVVEHQTEFARRNSVMFASGRRKTIRELTEDVQNAPKSLGSFETIFRKKLDEPSNSEFLPLASLNLPGTAIEALESRRSQILESRRRSGNNIYESVDHFPGAANYGLSYHNLEKGDFKEREYDNPAFEDEDYNRV